MSWGAPSTNIVDGAGPVGLMALSPGTSALRGERARKRVRERSWAERGNVDR